MRRLTESHRFKTTFRPSVDVLLRGLIQPLQANAAAAIGQMLATRCYERLNGMTK